MSLKTGWRVFIFLLLAVLITLVLAERHYKKKRSNFDIFRGEWVKKGNIGKLKHCCFCFKDSILAKDCYSAEEQKRKFCPAVCCFAVYHDVPLPCSLPSLLQQGDVCNSFFMYTSLVRFFVNFFYFD